MMELNRGPVSGISVATVSFMFTEVENCCLYFWLCQGAVWMMYQLGCRVVYLALQSHLCCTHHSTITTKFFWNCELLLSKAES